MLKEGTQRKSIVTQWMQQAAKGLAYVHSCGIIHGDGKASLPCSWN